MNQSQVADQAGTTVAVIEASGEVFRIETEEIPTGDHVLGAPVVKHVPKAVTGDSLPMRKGVTYIVSRMALEALRWRPDVVAPDTGPSAVRDDAGRIIAVRQFVTGDDHRARHQALKEALDELIADFAVHHPRKLLGDASVAELLAWAAAQADVAAKREGDGIQRGREGRGGER